MLIKNPSKAAVKAACRARHVQFRPVWASIKNGRSTKVIGDLYRDRLPEILGDITFEPEVIKVQKWKWCSNKTFRWHHRRS